METGSATSMKLVASEAPYATLMKNHMDLGYFLV